MIAEAEAHHDTPFQIFDRLGVDQEIAIAGLTVRGAIAVRMLVSDVVPYAHMQSHRYIQIVGVRQDADIPVLEAFRVNPASEVLAQPETEAGGIDRPVVQDSGLVPQSELSRADIAGDALGSSPDPRELEVVDRSRAVHRDMREDAAPQQVDHLARHAGLDHVRSHHQDAGAGTRRDQFEATGASRSGAGSETLSARSSRPSRWPRSIS